MYNNFTTMTASQWNEAVTSLGRRILTKVIINDSVELTGDGVDGAVVSIIFNEAIENSNGISMGTTIASSVDIEIRMPEAPIALTNSSIKPYVGLYANGLTEYVPLGEFFITKVESTSADKVVKIQAYDKLALLLNKYEPSISMPADIADVMADIASQYNITYSLALPTFTVDYIEATVREWIGWIAGLCGKNARMGRSGELEFVYYNNSESLMTISRDLQYSGQLNTKANGNTEIHSLSAGEGEEYYVAGAGRGISFENPFMTQERIDEIFLEVDGLIYRPLEVEWRGNPALQCGDSISAEVGLEIVPTLVMAHKMTVQGGLQDTLYCYGQSEAEQVMDNSPINKKIQWVVGRLQREMARAWELINGANGGIFEVTDRDGDGINDGWIIKASHDASFAGNCIVATSGGIGFSNNGGNTFQTAITTDGHIDGQFINARSISTDAIAVANESLSSYFKVDVVDGVATLTLGNENQGSGMILKQTGNRISFCNTQGQELAYWTNNEFVLTDMMSQMQIGQTLLKPQANGSLSFVRAI